MKRIILGSLSALLCGLVYAYAAGTDLNYFKSKDGKKGMPIGFLAIGDVGAGKVAVLGDVTVILREDGTLGWAQTVDAMRQAKEYGKPKK